MEINPNMLEEEQVTQIIEEGNEIHEDISMIPDEQLQYETAGSNEHDESELLERKAYNMAWQIINMQRIHLGKNTLHIDISWETTAKQYANYLKESSPDQNVFEEIYEKNYCAGETELINMTCNFEEDEIFCEETIIATVKEICNAFNESQREKQILSNDNINHIGLGISIGDDFLVLVIIVGTRQLTISKIRQNNENELEICGKMLTEKYGIYGSSLMDMAIKKEVIPDSGPENISFNWSTKEFVVTIKYQNALKQGNSIQLYIELFHRRDPKAILYKKLAKARLKKKDVILSTRIPCQEFPDLRYEKIDLEANQLLEQEIKRIKSYKEEESKENELVEVIDVSAKNDITNNSDDIQNEEDLSEMQQKEVVAPRLSSNQTKRDTNSTSNRELKEEQLQVLHEATKQHEEFLAQNAMLQEKIKALKIYNEGFIDKQQEPTMNEHKYLNMLINVHQIRLDLKQTQERYNGMANELQQKLDQKQRKCNEIKIAFMELKREVSRKAVFSRTNKPISEAIINQWEDREIEKNKVLQELRLEILRHRNHLSKNQRILKKREELAEGLHLIDFEQLKIENQTLNEKIEDRSEDLHKMRRKYSNTKQVWTHSREKLEYVRNRNDNLFKINEDVETELSDLRLSLNDVKASKDMTRLEYVKLKQETEIINRTELQSDYAKRKANIIFLKKKKAELEEKLAKMNNTIGVFHRNTKVTQSQNLSDRPRMNRRYL